MVRGYKMDWEFKIEEIKNQKDSWFMITAKKPGIVLIRFVKTKEEIEEVKKSIESE